jgi:hypothetical protein
MKLAATRNIKAIRPLLDRVLVSRVKAETVSLFSFSQLMSENLQWNLYSGKGAGEVI